MGVDITNDLKSIVYGVAPHVGGTNYVENILVAKTITETITVNNSSTRELLIVPYLTEATEKITNFGNKMCKIVEQMQEKIDTLYYKIETPNKKYEDDAYSPADHYSDFCRLLAKMTTNIEKACTDAIYQIKSSVDIELFRNHVRKNNDVPMRSPYV